MNLDSQMVELFAFCKPNCHLDRFYSVKRLEFRARVKKRVIFELYEFRKLILTIFFVAMPRYSRAKFSGDGYIFHQDSITRFVNEFLSFLVIMLPFLTVLFSLVNAQHHELTEAHLKLYIKKLARNCLKTKTFRLFFTAFHRFSTLSQI